jgi:trk system potassium uptake protein TrkH
MVIGACAGSTGGGLKCARVLLLVKVLRRNIHQVLHPQTVQVIRVNDRRGREDPLQHQRLSRRLRGIIVMASFILLSLDGFSLITNFSAVLSCFNNIGPGLDAVGPTCNFSALTACCPSWC